MRAQKPPCPCDFQVCLELAEEGGAVRAYLQMGLDPLRMCDTSTGDMSATETADAVGLIDQGADLHTKNNYGRTPLHFAFYGHTEVVKALLEEGAVE
jgi:ankyrin repeat protein